jgi:hypothetical protein
MALLQGEIRPGDYNRLLDFIATDFYGYFGKTLILASPGGDVREAMKIGALVKSSYQTVFVDSKIGECASACFFIYVASHERDATWPSIAIHRPYFAKSYSAGLSIKEWEVKQSALIRQVREYLRAQDVPGYLVEKMFSLSSSEAYWLTETDVNNLGPRALWYDQLLVDRCGLDKSLYENFRLNAIPEKDKDRAKAHIAEVDRCSWEQIAVEREAALRKALASRKPSPKRPSYP